MRRGRSPPRSPSCSRRAPTTARRRRPACRPPRRRRPCPERVDDGVLRVGVLLPETGAGGDARPAASSQAVVAAATPSTPPAACSASRSRSSPGSTRATVRRRPATPSPTSSTQDVDAVIGPASSTVALATLGDLHAGRDPHVLADGHRARPRRLPGPQPCSCAPRRATRSRPRRSPARPSAPGALTASVVYLDDAYGRPLAEATIAALQSRGIERAGADRVQRRRRDACSTRPRASQDSEAGVIIVIGDAEQGTAHARRASARSPASCPATIRRRSSSTSAMRRPPWRREQIAALAPRRAVAHRRARRRRPRTACPASRPAPTRRTRSTAST